MTLESLPLAGLLGGASSIAATASALEQLMPGAALRLLTLAILLLAAFTGARQLASTRGKTNG